MRSRRRKVGMSKNGEWKLKVAIASSIVFFYRTSSIEGRKHKFCVSTDNIILPQYIRTRTTMTSIKKGEKLNK